MIRKLNIFTCLAAGVLGACATAAPSELVDARASYQRATKGPAPEHARSQLQTAKNALDRAETAFEDEGADDETKDLAYVADRLARLAEAQAKVEIANREKAIAEKNSQMAVDERRRATETALSDTQRALAVTESERRSAQKQLEMEKKTAEQQLEALKNSTSANMETERVAAQARIDDANRQLEGERQQRLDAETRAKETSAALQKLGEVRESEKGLVLNISGSVIFQTGKATLLPAASEKLGMLADTLKSMDIAKKITIQGHTDSQGSDATNQRLSQARADAVRAFLIRRGVASDKLEAIGLGETEPVAENDTPEGRANNRRVEIVIARST